jgi:hypothetical protein
MAHLHHFSAVQKKVQGRKKTEVGAKHKNIVRLGNIM